MQKPFMISLLTVTENLFSIILQGYISNLDVGIDSTRANLVYVTLQVAVNLTERLSRW